jgi:outer membrane protein TolC
MVRGSLRLILLLSLVMLLFSANAAATLSMRQALQELKDNGYKWQQTNLLSQQASALELQAGAALSPQVEFVSRELIGRINQLQYGFDTPGDLNIFTLGSTAVQGKFPLVDSGAVARLNAAKENVKYNSDVARQYQSDLTYVMLAQFLNSQRLKKKLETIQTTLDRDAEIEKLANARVSAGVGLVLDLMRAKGLMEVDRVKELDIETTFKKSCQDFYALLGASKVKDEFPPLTYREIQTPNQEVSLQKSHGSRPDLLSSKSLLEVADKLRIQAEKQDNFRLELFGDLGVVGTHVIGGVGNAVTGTLAIQLTIPLIDGSYNKGLVQEASVKEKNLQLQDKQMALEADNQVVNNLAQLNESKKAVEASNNQISIAEAEMKLARKRFLSGTATGLELANAQGSLTTATDANVDATFSYEIAKLNYYKSIGDFDQYLAQQEGPR